MESKSIVEEIARLRAEIEALTGLCEQTRAQAQGAEDTADQEAERAKFA